MLGFSSTATRANFELVVRNLHGGVQTLDLSAADANAACALAAQDGLQVLACHARGSLESTPTEQQTVTRMGMDVANFSFELASLMAAGLSVMEALRTLAAKESHDQTRRALLDIVAGVSEGLPLSAAMQRAPGRYPPLLVATVSASEQTGDLSASLRRYAEHQLLIKALRDKVVGATIYPVLLLTMGCLVVMFLMTVVVPKFALLIASSRHELPWTSQLLMSWGSFAAQHAWQIRSGGVFLLVALLMTGRHVLRSGAKSAWLEKVPFIGPTMRKFRHAQLYRTTGMLVRGGIAVPKALQLGATLLGDADRTRLGQAISLIHEGRSLSHALEGAQLADPVATSMLTVAERTGDLADMLERIAAFHESRLQRSVEITSRLFEPLLMIVIGLVVAAIVVMMYLPIFDLASSLQ
ncbi:type II secretion system F family protein [Rhodoferax sp.]|uniref:type II secretion system F family protein n=1 Tax=Rhodoferax sp. TaxID=50421 RepID=UPI002842F2FA|nr:type II secretion system F family protein [Rhodoferax sp.]MDR3370136.1 type II secretion system F family protein [Rhodoferax sp.]